VSKLEAGRRRFVNEPKAEGLSVKRRRQQRRSCASGDMTQEVAPVDRSTLLGPRRCSGRPRACRRVGV